jgi:hypothetical protein|tara:strand:- start:12549 stop:13133 length:585 start_codon:yes stop_codon:yes gene_type:complete
MRNDIETAVRTEKEGIMQFPNELIPFIQFMKDHDVKTYLEIGVKRGHLVIFLQKLLGFEKTYACDINYPEQFEIHKPDIEFHCGSSDSKGYRRWREKIEVDLVLIDADHKYKPAKKDYLRELEFPHKYIALHDIRNKGYPDLARLWDETVKGEKVTFVNEDRDARLICLDHKDDKYMANYRKKYGHSCGIGVVW